MDTLLAQEYLMVSVLQYWWVLGAACLLDSVHSYLLELLEMFL